MLSVKVKVDGNPVQANDLDRTDRLTIVANFLDETELRRLLVGKEAKLLAEHLGLGKFLSERGAVKAIISSFNN